MTTRRPEPKRGNETEAKPTSTPSSIPAPADPPVTTRLYHALGPIAGALVLDAADFMTFGPVGLYVGFFVGAAIGWWLGGFYGFATRPRLLVAILAGIYTTVPSTEFIPLATILSACARFAHPYRPN